jgi:F-type H+-transporting ATPase subunit delta
MLEEHKGLIKARVTTAIHVDEDYKSRLREKLESLTGKQIEIIHKIDNKILGGVVVQMNYNVIDRSVKNQLNTLKHDLLSSKVY